ncbi:MAG: hypothetical protein HOL04_11805 [Gammaproteobacteria bacterium]|jgi:hypothetical protein|nr:hypothetical protein [Gammaproteobacteria bacterium]MBT4607613.1 hypothetical protein [Thiotrichales bacterium]MBT3472383.1 hypothetical protein [Gammaproteobacteria bacterium]MBT3968616.1 hypothetical protein [Gammaproteobacteria bacterium]MBT4079022.1 hypothetical protein [Gammaproteobacteria bacterium]
MSVVVKIAQKMGADLNATNAAVSVVQDDVVTAQGGVDAANQSISVLQTGKADQSSVDQSVALLNKAVVDAENRANTAVAESEARLLETDVETLATQRQHLVEIQENEDAIAALNSLAAKKTDQTVFDGYKAEIGTYADFEAAWNAALTA